jgi:hypothetical protein
MVVMITSTGVYVILALVFLVIIAGGVIAGYKMSHRQPDEK